MAAPLLAPDEAAPFDALDGARDRRILLVCDHASNAVPRALAGLGLDDQERRRHIAWDIGAATITRHLARRLNASALLAGYSRLVVDCNRGLADPSLMPEVSDGTRVPGNQGLSGPARQARIEALHVPYHEAIAAEVARLRAGGPVPVMLSIHSCTPVMNGTFRPWHIGICWEGDRRIAGPVMAELARQPDILVGDNLPYALDSREDHTVPRHAARLGLPHLQVEFRQDLIATDPDAIRWAEVLLDALRPVLARHGHG
jgi:predicted N-formylglutamate amidohydrolase